MNHFISTRDSMGVEIPDVNKTTQINGGSGPFGNLAVTMTMCLKDWGRAPTFLLLDFFGTGIGMKTVDGLNGVRDPVGRMKTDGYSADVEHHVGGGHGTIGGRA